MATLTQLDKDRLTSAFLRNPQPYIEALLYIRPKKGGKLIPFKLKPAQQRLMDLVLKMMREGRPVRIIILKARQEGFSTEIQALMSWFVMVTDHVECLTIAHKSAASKNLFKMFLRYHDNLLPEFRPMVKSRNENVGILEFGNPDPKVRETDPGLESTVKVETAEAEDAGRSGTPQFVHFSEAAFFTNKEAINAALNSVADIGAGEDPETGEWNPGTFVFVESTANGAAGDYHDMCQMARRGEGDFEFLFVAWFEEADYRRPVTDDEQQAFHLARAAIAVGSTDFDNRLLGLTAEEIDLIRRYNLDFGQIVWRRATIKTKCQGDVRKFQQEYPSNPDEAFLSSGNPWFDMPTVAASREAAERRPAPKRYRINEAESARQRRPVIVPDPYGELYIWHDPVPGRRYVIGADVSEGKPEGDNDVAQVLDHESCRQVAKIRGLLGTRVYARKLFWLGVWYNRGLLGVEINNMGSATVDELIEMQYPNLYGQMHDELVDIEPYEWGWRTTVRTRPLIVSRIQEAVNDRSLRTDNVDFWDEARTFVRNEQGKPEAQSGQKDDEVMAMAIALELREHMPGAVKVATGGKTTANQVNSDLAALRRSQLPV